MRYTNFTKIHELLKDCKNILENFAVTDTMQPLDGNPSIYVRKTNSSRQPYTLCFLEYAKDPDMDVISSFILLYYDHGWEDLECPLSIEDRMILIKQSKTVYPCIKNPTEEMTALHKMLWEV